MVNWAQWATTVAGFSAVLLPTIGYLASRISRGVRRVAVEAVDTGLTTAKHDITASIEAVTTDIRVTLTESSKKIAEIKAAADATSVQVTRLETDQFGTNHGGMREALDKATVMIVDQGKTLARVEGRLEEHLRTNSG